MPAPFSDRFVIALMYTADQGDELIMPDVNEDYASYLLRFYRVQGVTGVIWAASIQSTATGELRRFASLETLIRFFREEFGKDEKDERMITGRAR
jgi:hypothetical protein